MSYLYWSFDLSGLAWAQQLNVYKITALWNKLRRIILFNLIHIFQFLFLPKQYHFSEQNLDCSTWTRTQIRASYEQNNSNIYIIQCYEYFLNERAAQNDDKSTITNKEADSGEYAALMIAHLKLDSVNTWDISNYIFVWT